MTITNIRGRGVVFFNLVDPVGIGFQYVDLECSHAEMQQ